MDGRGNGKMSGSESAPSLSLSESCSWHIFFLLSILFSFWFAFEGLIKGMPYDSLNCFCYPMVVFCFLLAYGRYPYPMVVMICTIAYIEVTECHPSIW